VFRRVFPHDPSNYPYLGPLGRGWHHNYDINLIEFTDGRVAFHGPQDRFFKSRPDGSYESAPGDYSVLTRDQNGFFELRKKWIDLPVSLGPKARLQTGLEWKPRHLCLR
jgi:hypothetical protein